MEAEAASGSAGESSWSKVGTSLPVTSVQALVASAGELTVDKIGRYIQPDIDAHAVLPELSDEVPVIDLSKLLSAESAEAEAAKLRFACAEWGFFQVVNHGIPDEVITGIKQDIQNFFQLPLEVKNEYAQRLGDLQGYGQVFVVSDDQKLEWGDRFALFIQPPQARDMSYWPSQPHTFRNCIEQYSSEVMKFTHSLAILIAKTLEVDPKLVADKLASQFLRMNYYPPCTSTPEKVLGLSPHSDGSFLTILLEVNSVQGLQIRRHGAWIPVKPHCDALLVNVGDLLEIMTNGKYKSIEHRVTINAHKERLSISAFQIPNYDGIISPILETAEEKILYKTMKVGEYLRLYFSNKLEGKSALDYAKLSEI
ncbi:2-oxoglutarate-dependent dioxygenase 11-like [Triticum urartu]|uniref:Fe2OG dioxygenase domain-containing protein n=1 Tax=Triticum urartu TaxID=4572 RepID=A0A8R7TCK7_TRIUA|nr:S-norcoclaurine synthase 1-like [Triticum dicoccoides]XP_048560321.1 2-oxoglutarate-dependent dioxygenase 11-like [Triticum urartu]